MSLCVRTISNKLTPFVGTRKPITHLDRHQLPKHKKESAFLQEFLASEATTNNQMRERHASLNLIKPLTTSENIVAWNYKLRRDGNWNTGRIRRDSIKNDTPSLSDEVSVYGGAVFTIGDNKDEALRKNEKLDSSKIQQETSVDTPGRPTQEQLTKVYNVLREDLSAFFIKSVDYTIYHQMIEFENNIRGTVTKGIYEYVKQTAFLRIIGHLKFAYVKFDVLKITIHPEDDSIKVRWRIRGITGYKVFFMFWKIKVWNTQATIDQLDSWHDGFSTFYVNGNGQVVKHVADKMMPDQDKELSTKNKTEMATKLALFLGLLIPRECMLNISSLGYKCNELKKEGGC